MPLVGGDHLAAPLGFLVVVIGEEVLLVLFVHEAQPEIEPDIVRFIALDHFDQPVLPALEEGAAGFVLRAPLAVVVPGALIVVSEIQVVRLAVEAGVARIGGIVFRLPVGEEPPIFGVMHGHHKAHALGANGPLQLADDIALGAHLAGAPLGIAGIPHREAVMMLGDRAGEFGARALEELRPFIGIEMFGGEHRDEVFVAEFGRVAVSLAVVLELGRALAVHIVGIPGDVGAGGRHAVDAPVGVDAKLRLAHPLGRRVRFQRRPIRFISLVIAFSILTWR